MSQNLSAIRWGWAQAFSAASRARVLPIPGSPQSTKQPARGASKRSVVNRWRFSSPSNLSSGSAKKPSESPPQNAEAPSWMDLFCGVQKRTHGKTGSWLPPMIERCMSVRACSVVPRAQGEVERKRRIGLGRRSRGRGSGGELVEFFSQIRRRDEDARAAAG